MIAFLGLCCSTHMTAQSSENIEAFQAKCSKYAQQKLEIISRSLELDDTALEDFKRLYKLILEDRTKNTIPNQTL